MTDVWGLLFTWAMGITCGFVVLGACIDQHYKIRLDRLERENDALRRAVRMTTLTSCSICQELHKSAKVMLTDAE